MISESEQKIQWTLHPNGLETVEKNHIYTALSQAQHEFPTIRVNRKAFKNEYADLYAVLKHVYPVLSKYGLSIRPWGGMINGEQWIGARIMHKSGQHETNVFKFEADPCKNPNDQPSHKKQGALTYFNRNHMKDMLGVLISDDPEDDDGQSDYVEKEVFIQKQSHAEQNTHQKHSSSSFVAASEAQVDLIKKIASSKGMFVTDLIAKYGVGDITSLSKTTASTIIGNK